MFSVKRISGLRSPIVSAVVFTGFVVHAYVLFRNHDGNKTPVFILRCYEAIITGSGIMDVDRM